MYSKSIFLHIDENAQVAYHIHSFSKLLKDQNSPFGGAKESYIFKFRHSELAIDGDIYSKLWKDVVE